jgi:ActR/RegA family two-component response regulator
MNPETRVFMISGYYFVDDVCIVEALKGSGIHGFLAKPSRVRSILAVAKTLG